MKILNIFGVLFVIDLFSTISFLLFTDWLQYHGTKYQILAYGLWYFSIFFLVMNPIMGVVTFLKHACSYESDELPQHIQWISACFVYILFVWELKMRCLHKTIYYRFLSFNRYFIDKHTIH